MNKAKVAHGRRRNFKALRALSARDFTRASVKKDQDSAQISGRAGALRSPRRYTAARRPYQSSSSRKARDTRSRPHPRRRELDHAVQRYADLYDLAPTGYVSFDRSGRIEEINLTAAQLFGIPRERLIGMPFMVFVAREDIAILLHHLLRCRCSETRVETELRLKDVKRKIFHACLSSTPVAASVHNGALLYQTAIVDLTERKRTEELLRQKEAELERIVTQTPFMLTRCTRDLRYRYVSRAYAQMLDRKPEEIAGKPIAKMMGKEGFEAIRPYVDRVLAGETVSYEMLLRFKNGGLRCLRTVYVPDEDHGEVVGWIASILDVTEQKRAEEERIETLRQRGALYDLSQQYQTARTLDEIYEAALGAILTAQRCDRASILLYDKQQVMRFVAWRGLSEKYCKAVEGHSPWKPDEKNPEPVCVNDVDLADIPRSLKSTIRREGIRAAAFIPLVSGQKLIGKFMAYHNAPHLYTGEELRLATTIASQLAQTIEHKRDEKALRESEARLRATVEQATAGMARCDTNGGIVFANRTLCNMLGYTESELTGKRMADVTHRDDVKETMRLFRRMVQDGKPFESEKRYVCKDGSILWADVSAGAVRGPDGDTQSTVAVIVDVTARKKAEAALRKSKETLEQVVQHRTKALRITNAQLENEISRRKGLEGEILSLSDREQQRLGQELHDGLCQHLTAVAFMARSVALRLRNHRVIDASDLEKIAQLVNDAATDTRDLSRALHRLDVDGAGLVDALQDLVDREIWKTPCRLEVEPSFRIEDDAAAAHLYRIAREAVINANKHAQAREIVVKLARSQREIVLRVIDNGVGLSNDPKLKEGLGLHIMKYRSQLIGGRLEIDSHDGVGTRLSCYVPHRGGGCQRQQITGKEKWRGTEVLARFKAHLLTT